jgi:hypothetical protein
MGTSGRAEGQSTDLFGIGAGLAYYMPNNLYLSGTLAFAQLSSGDEDNTETRSETDFGPGLSLTFGKEWWVSDNWGLGVALNLFVARMKDKEAAYPGFDKPVWRGTAVSLLFSASFN